MADKKVCKIKNVVRIPTTSKDGRNTYNKLILIDEDNAEYKGVDYKITTVPNDGDKVELFYQTSKKVQNSKEVIENLLISVSILESEIKETLKVEVKKMTDSKYFKIRGKLFYAHIKEKDTKGNFPSNKYKAELSVDDKTAKALTSRGVEVKNKNDEKGQFVVMKSSFQPTVVDPSGAQLEEIPLIGNGSEAVVTVTLYDNKASRGGDKCLGMIRLELVNLVSYETPMLTDLEEDT